MAKAAAKTVTVGGKPYEKLDVITKRIALGGANQPTARTLRLKKKGWTVRACNTEMDNRYDDLINVYGYIDVKPEEVAGGLPQGSIREQDGKVVSGGGGHEIWVKIPTPLFNEVRWAKANRLERSMRSAKSQKAHAQEMTHRDTANPDRDRHATTIGGLSYEIEAGTEAIEIETK